MAADYVVDALFTRFAAELSAPRIRLKSTRRVFGQASRKCNARKPDRGQHSLMNPTDQLYRAISAIGF
jgi:hypothetical protein